MVNRYGDGGRGGYFGLFILFVGGINIKDSYLLLGYGCANRSLACYLKTLGRQYLIYDDNLADYRYDIDFNRFTTVVKSGGVPADHWMVMASRKLGKDIISDLELFYRLSPNKTLIAVTGTNGKTTTAALTAHILGDIDLGGNIGTALFDFIDSPRDIVIEASSFMLEDCRYFHPQIAVILNLSPHHLSRHGCFSKYVQAKMKIIANCKDSDIIIYNDDDPLLCELVKRKPGIIIPFSLKKKVPGCYLARGKIYFHERALLDIKKIPLIGEHNIANVMAALATALSYRPDLVDFERKIESFRSFAYRIEYLGSRDGINYYNDSKATNYAALASSLASFPKEKILLLCGGTQEEGNINLIAGVLTNIIQVIASGDNREAIERFFTEKGIPVVTYQSLAVALDNLNRYLGNATVVLLSPGAPSYDQFKDYKERGDFFSKWFLKK
ncbi:MAG: UDP-N-acetylmuramoyl-L-alanine--D-glutamate ligase [Bacilli bacterium]|nr:UDP-N-acetylmuramoyl-L-alanine--D-glutamate ligase [Bacilli bacterium]MDD4077663.1 UDP-N-acetylmuramoyl-L-alanine--D-glutamate ligase [Bacilli bacterium]MDD4387800.1 UDP-N-acetylmuramoyl-L-alanine--D-glutamate ligase [Bacilli bacterium]